MVARGNGLLEHKLAPDLLEPLLRPEHRGLRPVADLPQPGIYPPNHVLRVMPELLGDRVKADGLPVIERLEPGRAVGLAEHPRPDPTACPQELARCCPALPAGLGVEHGNKEAGPDGYTVQEGRSVVLCSFSSAPGSPASG
jgi:hypothetical protein